MGWAIWDLLESRVPDAVTIHARGQRPGREGRRRLQGDPLCRALCAGYLNPQNFKESPLSLSTDKTFKVEMRHLAGLPGDLSKVTTEKLVEDPTCILTHSKSGSEDNLTS